MGSENATTYLAIEKKVDGGTVRVHIPARTLEQERKFLERLDGVIRKAFPGRRLIMPDLAVEQVST